jgi:hypothetical protein
MRTDGETDKTKDISSDVHGSLHRSINLIQKEPTRCNGVVEFIIPVFLSCSTCFGRHTALHQELKNCNCSLWFYIRFWLPAAAMAEPSQWPAMMMGGVSPETC